MSLFSAMGSPPTACTSERFAFVPGALSYQVIELLIPVSMTVARTSRDLRFVCECLLPASSLTSMLLQHTIEVIRPPLQVAIFICEKSVFTCTGPLGSGWL